MTTNPWTESRFHQPALAWDGEQRLDCDTCIHVLFEARVAQHPMAIAVIDREQTVTYQQLNERANQVARYLIEMGVKPCTRVASCLDRSSDSIVAALGIIKAGAAYVPIDPQCAAARVHEIVRDSGSSVVLSRRPLRDRLEQTDALCVWMDCDSDSAGGHGVLAKQSSANLDRLELDVSFDRPAYALYASDFAHKEPVVGKHRGIVNFARSIGQRFEPGADEVMCQLSRIGSVEHVIEFIHALAEGAPLAIVRDETAQDGAALAQMLEHLRVTRIFVTPAKLDVILDRARPGSLRSLRYVFTSGGRLEEATIGRFHGVCGNARLVHLYGARPLGVPAGFHEVTRADRARASSYDFAPTASGWITAPDVELEQLKERFLDVEIPGAPLSFETYRDSLRDELLPYLVNVASPRFIGHMTSALPDFVAEMSRMIAQLNQNVVKIETSKALTLLERQVLAKLHRLFFDRRVSDYRDIVQDPDHVFGVFASGGSTANITALWCARNRRIIDHGIAKQDLIGLGAFEAIAHLGYSGAAIIASPLAHYSMRKAASVMGLGERNLLLLEQDASRRASLQDLEQKLTWCEKHGKLVIAVVGVAGATETGTIDPLADMARIAAKRGIPFHVDAAWGGAFIFSDRHRHLLEGISQADSITFCAHKQMFSAQGASLCLFRDTNVAHCASVHADYQARRGSFDMGQYTLEGSRPAASLLVHAILHVLSKEGLAWLVDNSMENVAHFRRMIEGSGAFELAGEPQTNIVNYRYIPAAVRGRGPEYSESDSRKIDEAVDAIQKEQFLRGRSFVSRTRISDGRRKIAVFRVVLSNPLVTRDDLHAVLMDQQGIAAEVVEGRCEGETIHPSGRAATT